MNNTSLNNTRIEWIDMAKGYGIILVLIGHLNIPIITPLIYTFHIPLFFFLSGYVFNADYGFKLFLLKKMHKIIIPYFFLSIPMIFANLLFEYGRPFSFDELQTETSQFFIQERHTTMWFLSCLFVLNILIYPIIKIPNTRTQYGVVLFISIWGLLLWRTRINTLPWNCDAAFVVLPFMYCGYIIKTKSITNKLNIFNWHYAFFFFFITCLCGFINYRHTGWRVDLFYSLFAIEPLSYINSFVGIMALIIVSKITKNSAIKYIGHNSILYFAWHQTIIFPSIYFLYEVLGLLQVDLFPQEVWMLFMSTITIILTIAIITLLNEVISHSRLKFIIGK